VKTLCCGADGLETVIKMPSFCVYIYQDISNR